MNPREKAMAEHPSFPWLEAGQTKEIEKLLRQKKWLAETEKIERADRAGEGNMNLTLRIETNVRSFILKQARPWVEKYPDIEAPWERSSLEQAFYVHVAQIPEVASKMPYLIRVDSDTHITALEYLPGAKDLSSLYSGQNDPPLSVNEIEQLAAYLAALHEEGSGADPTLFENRAMRELNHAHIFKVPLEQNNGLDLDAFEVGLQAAAVSIKQDADFIQAVRAHGQRYLKNGQTLLHGDFFAGSWLRTEIGLRVIDPEFAFLGSAEFDLGCALGHFALAQLPVSEADFFLTEYAERRGATLSFERIAQTAACEVMRRLIGVGQLPIQKTDGWRVDLLEKTRSALIQSQYRTLFI